MIVNSTSDLSSPGLAKLVLDNGVVRVVVLPELGGKIWELTDLRTGRDALWHNPGIAPRSVPFGSAYDDNFLGGWDELFPNDEPEVIGGDTYPDHGELWASPWAWSLDPTTDGTAGATLTCKTPISNCSFEKRIVLEPGEAAITVDLNLVNNSRRALPFLWKQHVAVPADSPATIGLPPSTVYVEDFGTPRARPRERSYLWPEMVAADGAAQDMSRTLPPQSQVAEFQYATGLSEGWCSLTKADGTGIRLNFDPVVFPACWTFASYGGWRGHEVVILEPCTGHPLSVADGLAAGTHRVLAPGEVVRTSVVATLVAP